MDEKLRFVIDLQNKASAELRKLSKDMDGVKPGAGMKNTAAWFQTLEGASGNATKAMRPLVGGLNMIGAGGLAAGLSITGLINQFRDLAKAMPALQELSRQTGISKTELERLKATAANLNIDPSKMTAAIGYFSGEMVQFSKQSGEVYAEMQNGASGLARKIAAEWKEHPEEALKDYLGWLAQIPEASKRAGKSAQEGVQIQRYWAQKGLGDADMAQAVGKGMGGFQEAYREAARDVHEITDETVAAAEKFDRSIASFERTWKDFETTVGPTVFQSLSKATDDFRGVFEEIKTAAAWFDQVKNHPVQAVAEAAENAIDAQAEENKRNPRGIVLDLPGAASDVIHNAIGDRRPVVQPQDNNLGLPGLDNVAPDSRPATLRAPVPRPTALQPAPFHPDDDRLSRARASDADGWKQQQDLKNGVLQQFGALEKPILHLSGSLKTASADLSGDGIRPAAFHPAGGAGLSAALDPQAIVAAGTKEGVLAAFREWSSISDMSAAESRAAGAYDNAGS